ncbi:MAG: hypothetical protein H6R40_222 [Gemmatimonadetes bacterium]|nr:hypothetical protein [Gemmatimonadota bacterium]
MTRAIPKVVERLLARADTQLGPEYSAVLYGSWVRGDVLEGRSDVNLLLVAPRITPAELRGLSGELAVFEAERMAPPLLFTTEEWRRAGDSFPIEITDMKLAYRMLRGADPLAGMKVRPGDLRRSLESELRGKLLRLRADYALYASRPELLAAVVGHSIGSFRVLFRGVLTLGAVAVPGDDGALAQAAGRLCGFAPGPLEAALAHRRHTAWRCAPDVFESYLGVIERTTLYVDTVHPGVH